MKRVKHGAADADPLPVRSAGAAPRIAAGLLLAAGALLPALAFAQDAFTTGNINMRTGPGTGYDRIGTLPQGTGVDILGCVTGWCQVSAGGPPGWVSDNYLQDFDDAPPPYRPPPPVYEPPPVYQPPVIVVPPPYYGPGYGPPPYYGPGYRPPPVYDRPPGYRPPPNYNGPGYDRPPGNRPPPAYRPPQDDRPPGYRPPQGGGQRPPGAKPPQDDRPVVRPPPAQKPPPGVNPRPPGSNQGANPGGQRPPGQNATPGQRPPGQGAPPGQRPPNQGKSPQRPGNPSNLPLPSTCPPGTLFCPR